MDLLLKSPDPYVVVIINLLHLLAESFQRQTPVITLAISHRDVNSFWN